MNLVFRRAESTEYAAALELLYDAAVWLRNNGIDYWQNWLDPPAEHLEWILDGFRKSEFFFVESDSEIVGMFRLLRDDPMFWGERTESAFYIHSLTTRRSLSGIGLGYQILKKIEESARVDRVDYLRLDCGLGVPKLQEYYTGFGFTEVGTVKVDVYDLVLLEKRVADIGSGSGILED